MAHYSCSSGQIRTFVQVRGFVWDKGDLRGAVLAARCDYYGPNRKELRLMEVYFLGEERLLEFSLRTRFLKRLFAPLVGALLCLVVPYASMAGLFGPSLPKGREVEDPYLARLFEPDFPYESIKVIETEEGKRYVVIKAKRSIDDRAQSDYCYKMLPKRNIVLYRAGSEWTKTVLVAELTMYRFPSERPYVVEYSRIEGQPKSDKPWAPVESLVEFDGRYIIVQVDKEFGRVFRRFVLYPEEDAGCPDPPFVGRYPNSRSLACFAEEDRIVFVYVTPDSKEAVFDYYKPLLKAHYDSVGFCYPETRWGPNALYGLVMRSIRLSELVDLLREKDRAEIEVGDLPFDRIILDIRADNVIGPVAMKNHTLIRIRLAIGNQVVSELVQGWKRYCAN
jgi:hypothetical protein